LASIAKENGIFFNGIVDKKLLDIMIYECGGPAVENKTEDNNVAQKETTPAKKTKKNKQLIKKETTPKTKATPVTVAAGAGANIVTPEKAAELIKEENTKKAKEEVKPVQEKKEDKEDEVFSIIEQPDPNIDPKMYENRTSLSETDKAKIKNTYKEILQKTTKEDQEKIINTINDRKIIR
jgi:hypothetical protein